VSFDFCKVGEIEVTRHTKAAKKSEVKGPGSVRRYSHLDWKVPGDEMNSPLNELIFQSQLAPET
jgi:hypothetical protein